MQPTCIALGRGSVMVSPGMPGPAKQASAAHSNLEGPIMRVLSASDGHLSAEISEKDSAHKFRYSRYVQCRDVRRLTGAGRTLRIMRKSEQCTSHVSLN